jgi:ligand-binding SRPBCC domain-containing protein
MPAELDTRIDSARIQAAPVRPLASALTRHFPSVAAGAGSEIQFSFSLSWLPMRVRWTARVTEFAWYSHFCDEQIQGPFTQFRHRHSTVAEMRDDVLGTLVTDVIDYALPLGFIGRLGSGLVRRQLALAFGHRQQRLPESLSVAARLAAYC